MDEINLDDIMSAYHRNSDRDFLRSNDDIFFDIIGDSLYNEVDILEKYLRDIEQLDTKERG